jgi:hypothetical protein
MAIKSNKAEINDAYPSIQLRRLEREQEKLKNDKDANDSDDDPHKITNPLILAKLEKLQVETEKLKLDIAITHKQYIHISELSQAVEKEYTRIRQKLLGIGPKVSHIVAPITNPIEIKQILDEEVNEILEELSYDKTLKE